MRHTVLPPALPGLLRHDVLHWPIAGADGTALTLAVRIVDFTVATFGAAAFGQAGEPMPAQIARSVPKRQAEYLYGRLAARLALAAAGLPVAPVGTGAAREPLWPAGTLGSITHNSRHAGAVALPAGPWRGVGIDIESPAAPEQQDSLAQLTVDAAELRLLERCPAPGREVLLPLVFSAKESFYKAAYGAVGRFFDFSAIRVVAVEPQRLVFTVAEPLCARWSVGTTVHAYYTRLADGDLLTAVVW